MGCLGENPVVPKKKRAANKGLYGTGKLYTYLVVWILSSYTIEEADVDDHQYKR
jgi:hypothetical protein